MSHQGRDKTVSLVRDRLFWCGMVKDVEEYIKSCDRCIRRKTPTNEKAPLVNITTYQPLELVCMDFLSLETSKGGYQSILVITDHFTRYAVAVPTKNQTAKTTAEAFINHFVVHYGLPQRIHSDQGANFESRLIKEICSITGMAKSRTTPYHAMGNGLCERMNRSLLSMLGTLDSSKKHDWKSHVTTLVHAYNCTRQDSTGYSPYFLLFGREPNLPMDIVFGLTRNSDEKSLTSYAASLKKRLEEAYKLATTNSDKARSCQKQTYDQKARSAIVKPGDIVLVKIVAFDGKHKLSDKWEDDPYLVLSQPNPDIPVYVVQKHTGEGRKRTLHRNMLLPIKTPGTRVELSSSNEKNRPIPAPRKRKSKRRPTMPETAISNRVESSTESDSDDELLIEVSMPEHDVPLDVTQGHDTAEEQSEESEDSEPVEDDGDAHASVAETSGEESEEPVEPVVERTPPTRPPRRSERNRRPPERYRSGDYVMSLQSQPEWIQRAEYLRGIASSGILRDHTQDIADTLLKIVASGT